jgi:hypothetical protein
VPKISLQKSESEFIYHLITLDQPHSLDLTLEGRNNYKSFRLILIIINIKNRMTSKFIEIGPGQNLPPTIKEADNLFIGGKKLLIQWSVSKKKVTKDYGDIIAGCIRSAVQTSYRKYLFFSDDVGS